MKQGGWRCCQTNANFHCPRADSRHQEKLRKILWATIRGCPERSLKPGQTHIARPHVMMGRHDQVLQKELPVRCGG
jgi:hypothetical protein